MLLRALLGKLKKLIAAGPAGCVTGLTDPEPGIRGRSWVASEGEVLVEGNDGVEARMLFPSEVIMI